MTRLNTTCMRKHSLITFPDMMQSISVMLVSDVGPDPLTPKYIAPAPPACTHTHKHTHTFTHMPTGPHHGCCLQAKQMWRHTVTKSIQKAHHDASAQTCTQELVNAAGVLMQQATMLHPASEVQRSSCQRNTLAATPGLLAHASAIETVKRSPMG